MNAVSWDRIICMLFNKESTKKIHKKEIMRNRSRFWKIYYMPLQDDLKGKTAVWKTILADTSCARLINQCTPLSVQHWLDDRLLLQR